MLKYCLLLLCLFFNKDGRTQSMIDFRHKEFIRQAIHISKLYGEKIWKEIDQTPFSILLLTDSAEILLYHDHPPKDYSNAGWDDVLKTNVHSRPLKWNKHLLAAMPVNGISCIVAGTPGNTNKQPTEWIVSLLHEHFHQFQQTQKDYYSEVASLDLAGGDETGMWMLNYPFPYDSAIVKEFYLKYTTALQKTVSNINSSNFKSLFKKYLEARNQFKKVLPENDYRYFSFQVWQEGIARYTEYKFLEYLKTYTGMDMMKYKEALSFPELETSLRKAEIRNLTYLDLSKDKRICFYSIGFAEGLLLDKVSPLWKENYLNHKFFIEKYFEK